MSDDTLKRIIFSLVVALWAMAFSVDIFDTHFEVPTVVHGLVASIIGYFVGANLKRSK